MLLEIRRFIHSAFLPITVAIAAGFFGFGVVLEYATAQSAGVEIQMGVGEALLADYVIFTQFGLFILSALMVAYVCTDFNEHSILFYRSLGFSSARYHVAKTLTMVLFFTAGTIVGLTATCAVFGDFRPWLVMFLHYEAVVVTYFSLYALVACLLPTFIQAYFVIISYSIVAILVAVANPALRVFQFFDQNGFVYLDLQENITDLSTFVSNELPNLPICLGFAAAMLLLAVLVSYACKKRWLQNGIR